VFSIGDLIVGAGLVVISIELLLPPVVYWFRRGRPSPT
jgi:hypothetical protein